VLPRFTIVPEFSLLWWSSLPISTKRLGTRSLRSLSFFRLFSGLSSWRLFPVTHGAVVTKPNYCTFYIIHLRFPCSFSDTFNTLQPTCFPGFAFSCHLTWVRLDLSHGLVREYRPISVRTTIRGIKGGLESPEEEAGGGG